MQRILFGLGVVALIGTGCVRYGTHEYSYPKDQKSWEFICPSSVQPGKGTAERSFHVDQGQCVLSATQAAITSWSHDFKGYGFNNSSGETEFLGLSVSQNGSLRVSLIKNKEYHTIPESESQQILHAFLYPLFYETKRSPWVRLLEDRFVPDSAFYEDLSPRLRSLQEMTGNHSPSATQTTLRVQTEGVYHRPTPDFFIPYAQVSCGTQDRVSSGIVRRASEDVRTDAQLGVLISPKIWEGWNTTSGLTLGTDPLAKDHFHGLTELSFLGISRASHLAMSGVLGYSSDRDVTLRGDVYLGKVTHAGFSGDADSHQGAFGFAFWDAALFDAIPLMSSLSFDWTLTSYDRDSWCARGYSWGNRLDLDARVLLIGPVWLGVQAQYQTHTYDLSGNQQGGLWTGALQLACRF